MHTCVYLYLRCMHMCKCVKRESHLHAYILCMGKWTSEWLEHWHLNWEVSGSISVWYDKLSSGPSCHKWVGEGLLNNCFTNDKLVFTLVHRCSKSLTPEQQAQAEELQQKMKDRKDAFHEMEECLPHKNGYCIAVCIFDPARLPIFIFSWSKDILNLYCNLLRIFIQHIRNTISIFWKDILFDFK